MSRKITLVVTSIASPNQILSNLAQGCVQHDLDFILIGDTKSPQDFALDGCNFYSVEKQLETGFSYAQKCPTRHYARKNIGYLLAVANGTDMIFETDDDNDPLDNFWHLPCFQVRVRQLQNTGWTNLYKYFSDDNLWPRGLALEAIQNEIAPYDSLEEKDIFCPIQQGVVNGNPDVDAICRLIRPVDQTFRSDRQVAIGSKTWCPFNSQSTKWTREAFALMYLPAYCSFRMTDIWRSFIAQRIAWENDWFVLFHEPMMFQERNPHNLLKDFEDEIPGYLNNSLLCKELEQLSLKPGKENIPGNLNRCYEKLISLDIVGKEELPLLNLWLEDLNKLCD